MSPFGRIRTETLSFDSCPLLHPHPLAYIIKPSNKRHACRGVRAATVELNCKTDFVTRSQLFGELLDDLAWTAAFISDFDAYNSIADSKHFLDRFLLPAPLLSAHKPSQRSTTDVGGAVDALIAKVGGDISLSKAVSISHPLPPAAVKCSAARCLVPPRCCCRGVRVPGQAWGTGPPHPQIFPPIHSHQGPGLLGNLQEAIEVTRSTNPRTAHLDASPGPVPTTKVARGLTMCCSLSLSHSLASAPPCGCVPAPRRGCLVRTRSSTPFQQLRREGGSPLRQEWDRDRDQYRDRHWRFHRRPL